VGGEGGRGAAAESRVARWFVFKQKIPIWANFGDTYVDLKICIYFVAIWNTLKRFRI
jgi:hypothetical protein